MATTTERRARKRGGGWWPFAAASAALFALLMGSNLPTPLFPLYTKVYGLTPLVVSLLFATADDCECARSAGADAVEEEAGAPVVVRAGRLA